VVTLTREVSSQGVRALAEQVSTTVPNVKQVVNDLQVRQLVAVELRVYSQGDAMSFGLYSIGFAIVIGGLMYAAHLLHVPAHWIAVGAIVMIGVGILKGVKATRQKDPMGQ
jgi:hypothetical protein